MIYDCKDSTSFFMMSIEFTLGNTENLKREHDINGGIYTAKAKEKRFIGSKAPYGYSKEGEKKARHLVINEAEAAIVRFIYNAYVQNIPIMQIAAEARKQGFAIKGNSAVQKILANPLYSGQQLVKPWKEHPGGLMPLDIPVLIDIITWSQVQHKMKGAKSKGISLKSETPLRGVLHCACGRLLTSAPSRGRHGSYYNYYKCNTSRHLNLSANYAHDQLHEMLGYLSVPDYIIAAIKDESQKLLDDHMKASKNELKKCLKDQQDNENKIYSMEEKYLANALSYETYNRWHNDLQQRRIYLKAKIEQLGSTDNELNSLLQTNLQELTDMQNIYTIASTIQKQQMLNMVFDNRLYYKDRIYRTPYLFEIFQHNTLILKQKRLLLIDEKRGESSFLPSGGAAGNRTLVQTYPP